jgi:hypothetical protein
MRRLGFFLFVLISGFSIKAQNISPFLLGSNAWQPTWQSGSKLPELWDDLKTAGYQMIRVGGNGAQNSSDYTKERIGDLVAAIRTSANAEPIVQIPRTFTAAQTTTLITYLNGTRGLKVKYWTLGNEPNLDNDWSDPIPLSQVAAYIKTNAQALKTYDPTVKIIGPDPAWYDNNYINPLFVNAGTNNVSGKDENGNYYLDVLCWHKYGITSGSELDGEIGQAIGVINKINLTRPAENKMSWAIGEINSHYSNDMATADQKTWSFNAGQMFAELYDQGMRKGALTICSWSIFESGGNRSNGDLSLFDMSGGLLKGRSSYYHVLMLGQNMKTKYLTNADNKSDVTVVSMGDSTGFAIMIMNKNNTKSYEYSLGLNGAYGTEKELKIKVSAGLTKELSGTIGSNTTKMMVFDAEGKLLKRYSYNEADANKMSAPTIEQFTGMAGEAGVLEFTSPVKNSRKETTDTIKVEVNAQHSSGIASVTLFMNDSLIGTDISAPFQWLSDSSLINLPVGKYNLKAIAITTGGDSISSAVDFSVMAPAVLPQVSFTYPLNGAEFEAGVNLQVTGVIATHPAGISNVKLYVNNVLDRQENIAPYDWGLDGQTDPLLKNMKAGTYTLKAVATATSGEVNEASITIVVKTKTDIQQLENVKDAIKIFPIPVVDNVIFNNINEYQSIEIYNQVGQLLKTIKNSNAESRTIDMVNYSRGIYVVRFLNSTSQATYRIVKE